MRGEHGRAGGDANEFERPVGGRFRVARHHSGRRVDHGVGDRSPVRTDDAAADLDAAIDIHDDRGRARGEHLILQSNRRHVIAEHHDVMPSLGSPHGHESVRAGTMAIGFRWIGATDRGGSLRQ